MADGTRPDGKEAMCMEGSWNWEREDEKYVCRGPCWKHCYEKGNRKGKTRGQSERVVEGNGRRDSL